MLTSQTLYSDSNSNDDLGNALAEAAKYAKLLNTLENDIATGEKI